MTDTTPHRVLLAPTLDLALTVDADVTVECEFGATVVCGRVATFAHHVPSAAHNPSPCANSRVDRSARHIKSATVLLSHIDLDSIGGALRALDALPTWPDFWNLAGAVDVRGPHRLTNALDAIGVTSRRDRASLTDALRAFWAWGRSRPRFPRDVVSDVTAEVLLARDVIEALCARLVDGVESPEVDRWVSEGRMAAAAEDALESSSRRRCVASRWNGRSDVDTVRVVCREADQFVAHLHRIGKDTDVVGTASLDTRTGAITIALADPVPGVSCAAVARSLWGADAGGHVGIAGSPRGQVMPEEDVERAAQALANAVVEARANPTEVPETPERWIPARQAHALNGWNCSTGVHDAVLALTRPADVRAVVLEVPAVRWGESGRVEAHIAILGVLHEDGENGNRVTVPLGSLPAVRLPVPSWVFNPDEPALPPVAKWMTVDEASIAWTAFTT